MDSRWPRIAGVITADVNVTAERLTRDSAVIHVNLVDDDTPRAIERRLERVAAWANGLCIRNCDLKHLAVVLGGCSIPQPAMLRLARRFALSLHQLLEMERGSYIAVTAVLNSLPMDPALLRERLVSLTRCETGLDPAVAVTALEIAARDIHDVSINEIV